VPEGPPLRRLFLCLSLTLAQKAIASTPAPALCVIRGHVVSSIVEKLTHLISYRIGDKEQSIEFNQLLNFERNLGHKKNFKCKYRGCKQHSINSHELSKSQILEKLSDSKSKVFCLIEHCSDNSLRYKMESKHIKGVTTFPGYCKDHDESLFSSIENTFTKLDSEHVHKQAARTTRKQIYSLELHVRILLKKLKETKSTPRTDTWVKLFQRVLDLRIQLNRYRRLHKNIWNSIDNHSTLLYYKIKEVENKGIAYAGMFDLTEAEDEHLHVFFIFVLPIENKCYLVCATIDMAEIHGLVNDIFPENEGEKFFIQAQILKDRKNIVFSARFLDSLEYGVPEELLDNPNFVSHGIIPCIELF